MEHICLPQEQILHRFERVKQLTNYKFINSIDYKGETFAHLIYSIFLFNSFFEYFFRSKRDPTYLHVYIITLHICSNIIELLDI